MVMLNEIQRITATGLIGDGSFTLYTEDGSTSVNFTGGALTTSDVSTALENTTSAANFDLTDNGNGTIDVEWIGEKAGIDVGQMSIEDLVGSGTIPTVSTIQEAGESGGGAGARRVGNHGLSIANRIGI